MTGVVRFLGHMQKCLAANPLHVAHGTDLEHVCCLCLGQAQAWKVRVANFHIMPVVSTTVGGPSGPTQTGRGCNGQYVYWIVMVQPTPEVLQITGTEEAGGFFQKDFSREGFFQRKPGKVLRGD